jgi:hypothetical protein
MGSTYGGLLKFLWIMCLSWNLESSKVYNICILVVAKEIRRMSSTIIVIGSSVVEDGLETQQDIANNFKQRHILSYNISLHISIPCILHS